MSTVRATLGYLKSFVSARPLGSLLHAALLLAAGAASSACSSEPSLTGANQGKPQGGDHCATPTAGCPCSDDGTTAACGSVLSREGTHVECSEGKTTCTAGTWGTCVGETTHTLTVPLPRTGIGALNLGMTPGSCTDSPCDPYCQSYNDTPPGFDAGADSGITTTDAGVSLTGITNHTTACTGFNVTPTPENLTVTSIPLSGSIVYTPASPTFTSAFTPASCYTGEPPTVWVVDNPTISTISAAGVLNLVSPIAGTFHVTGYSGGLNASATVNVVVNAVDTSSAPTGYTGSSFTGTSSTADSITVLYPYNNTVLPLGLPAPVVQWSNNVAAKYSAANTANAVRVQLRYPAGTGALFTWSGIIPELQSQPLAVASTHVASVSYNGTVATLTTSSDHGLTTGDVVQIASATGDTTMNGTWPVTVTPTSAPFTTFTIPVGSGSGSYSANSATVTYLGQPRAFPPQNVWSDFEQTAKGGAADIVIQRIVGGVLLQPNPPINIQFATDQLKGTVYYQSYGTNLLQNYTGAYLGANFGAGTLSIQPGATTPSVTAGTNTNQTGCVVCHSVASGGSLLTTQLFTNEAQTYWYSLPSASPTPVNYLSPADGRFAWAALSSDGTYLFSNSGNQTAGNTGLASNVYSVPGGGVIASTGLPSINAMTPSFSPDNRHVGFNFYGGTASGHNGDQASLATIDYDPGPSIFSNFRVLATPGSVVVGGSGLVGSGNIYYPAYLPSDTQLIWELQTAGNGRDNAGTRSQCDSRGPTSCQNDGTHAELWWTDVASATSAKLANLNGGSYLPTHVQANNPSGDNQLNYEPTVNPQVTGGYSWAVFTSRRVYGNIATVNPYWSDPRFEDISEQPTTKKLWVSAINPSATPGTDPSYPAFYLPGQELLAGNSRGYFVQNPCEPAGTGAGSLCTSTLDCCSSVAPNPPVQCALDAPPATTAHCSTSTSATCAPDGSACSTSSQCCNFPSTQCAQNVCKPSQTITYNASSFTVVYDGTMCPPGMVVSWVDVGLEALTPASGGTNTNIVIGAQTSGAVGGSAPGTYLPATPVHVGTLTGPPADQTGSWNNFPLSTPLSTIGPTADSQPFLQVTFALNPSVDQAAAPTIVDWRVRFDCIPNQ